jgi:glycosyltransferase involved in cell wall biosynthesis
VQGLKVSVVVIAKNAEKTIARCLDSLFTQTRKPDEVIVVDGRSTDKTREIAEKFPTKIITAPAHDTYGTSRNLGVKEATGEIVAFLDSDDQAEEKWLESLVNVFGESDIAIAGSKRIYVYPHTWFSEFKWDLLGGRKPKEQERNLREAKQHRKEEHIPVGPFGKYLGTSGSAYKKEAIEKAGYFDEDLFFGCEDIDLANRILKTRSKAVFVPEAKIYFNVAASVGEWFKESFWRRGMGYGALRRRHGHYNPPVVTPVLVLAFLVGLLLGLLWHSAILTVAVIALTCAFLLFRAWRYASKTGNLHYSLAYAVLEVFQRMAILLGFAIGFTVPTKTLRRIVKGKSQNQPI